MMTFRFRGMFEDYFEDWEVKTQFEKEYVSLWSGWLGKEGSYLLDDVTEEEWSRFNLFVSDISKNFELGIADCKVAEINFPSTIAGHLSSYRDSMNKDSSRFSKFVIPKLECVITEEWDYTYIIWHKNNGAVEALDPYILTSKLHHFSS